MRRAIRLACVRVGALLVLLFALFVGCDVYFDREGYKHVWRSYGARAVAMATVFILPAIAIYREIYHHKTSMDFKDGQK